ncbi:hypothetical protein EZ456_05035 [Pedobacter psychrodurus]|uniref:Uncharacterized protein n=1 Tax=Pedobacter psychrodurus TaxID=2530456 RepID=A0A4R0Q4X0_9SPHI|nr:hypothetical protein [Pedobacter psychrodurus]TCD28748.1 hypothetical protein EZ456_05035 [Pedobacter psychrodurus]
MKKIRRNKVAIGKVAMDKIAMITAVVMLLMFSAMLCAAQKSIRDESMVNQQERMVFKQWDRSKFTPTSGWLGINPYYWLTWGLHPNYPKTDLRPLAGAGTQLQRLSLASLQKDADRSFELHSDSLGNVAKEEILGHSGLLSATDPLWVLYYSRQLRPVTDFDPHFALDGLATGVRAKLISEGSYDWYMGEMKMLGERLDLTRKSNQDRGARILSYHGMLMEYRKLMGIWSTRVSTAGRFISQGLLQKKIGAQEIRIEKWNENTDVEIAREVLRSRKY